MTIRAELGRLADLLEEDRRERVMQERRDWDREHIGNRGAPTLVGDGLCTLLAVSAPEFPLLFKQVIPEEFWVRDRFSAVISCPCGETPEAIDSSLSICECGRTYLYDGSDVRVHSEKTAAAATES